MDANVEVLETKGSSSRQSLDDRTRSLFDQGIEALESDRACEAVALLREANELEPDHAQLRSVLGLAIARGENNFAEARRFCESAAKQEFFNPDLYLNLAKIYLCFGRRSEALRYLRRGQMIDPGHSDIRGMIKSLGKRRLPIVPFLPRRHALNRALGTARNRVMDAFSRA
jgi:Flp pilus assembly protein TadD